jgi:hypothetical protein
MVFKSNTFLQVILLYVNMVVVVALLDSCWSCES